MLYWVRSLLLRPIPVWRIQLIAATCVAVAIVGRLLIVALVAENGLFLPFLPSILVAALLAGPWGGLSALIYGSLVIDYFWLPPIGSFELSPYGFRSLALFWLFSGSLIAIAALIKALLRAVADSELRATTLAAEATHRMRNVLGLVQAISRQTFRTARDPSEFQAMFEARISALGRAHELIADSLEKPADLGALLKTVLEPFGAPRITLSGAPTGVPREIGATLALVIHELGTNAAKFGALSAPGGEVTVRWEREAGGVRLDWKESNGPRVAPPARTGFGSRLLKTAFASDCGASSMTFEPDGVECQIRFPAAPAPRRRPWTTGSKPSALPRAEPQSRSSA